MLIANIVDYLASKAKASDDEKGYVTIQETVYRINDNYTYSYFTEYREALEHYANKLDLIMGIILKNEANTTQNLNSIYGCFVTSTLMNEAKTTCVLQLDRIEVDYYDNELSSRKIYDCLKWQDTTIYEFEYKKGG